MTDDMLEKAAQIFADAVALEPESRDAYIEEACREDPELLAAVRSLLDGAEESEAWLQGIADKFSSTSVTDPSRSKHDEAGRPDSEIGPYTLLEPVGQGGAGIVWLAKRNDGQFDANVAIKIVAADGTTEADKAEVNQEAQHLADLSHPNIAQLLDAGIDDRGHRYLVLEYVDGAPIDRYCDEQRLDVKSRVLLFLDVLQAVAHAHRHLIVHRDLKPSNVLVTGEGVVKLLDFGVARLLRNDELEGIAQQPEHGIALTPQYAAPEQLMGHAATTAADVYALGLMLYELLTGRSARDVADVTSYDELLEAATENPPTASDVATDADLRRTSSARLQRTLRGDLDSILQKALNALPEDRYPSAAEFAGDLNRFLRTEPVEARESTASYKLRKFAARHRGGVISAALTTLALVAAVVLATMQMIEARKQRDIALYEQQRVQASNEFYSLLLEDIGSGGRSFTAVEMLDRGVEMLDKQFDSEQPFVGRIHYDLSRRYSNMRETLRELELLNTAEQSARSNGDLDLLAAALCGKANATLFSDAVAARDWLDEGNAVLRRYPAASTDSRIACLRMDARVAEMDGDRAAAIGILERARGGLLESDTVTTHLRGVTLNDLALLYYKEGLYDESIAVLDEVLALLDRTGRGNTLGYLQVLNNQSAILGTVGEVAAEIAVKERLMSRLEEAAWADGRATLSFRQSYGTTLVRLSRFEEGVAILEDVRSAAEDQGSDINVAMTDLSLAAAYVSLDRLDDAELSINSAESALSGNSAAWDFQAARVEVIRANIARKRARLDEARSRIDGIFLQFDYPPLVGDSAALATAINSAIQLELASENYPAAERLADDYLALKIAAARQAEASADVGNALFLRARARAGRGDVAAAGEDVRDAITALIAGLGEDNAEVVAALAFRSELDQSER